MCGRQVPTLRNRAEGWAKGRGAGATGGLTSAGRAACPPCGPPPAAAGGPAAWGTDGGRRWSSPHCSTTSGGGQKPPTQPSPHSNRINVKKRITCVISAFLRFETSSRPLKSLHFSEDPMRRSARYPFRLESGSGRGTEARRLQQGVGNGSPPPLAAAHLLGGAGHKLPAGQHAVVVLPGGPFVPVVPGGGGWGRVGKFRHTHSPRQPHQPLGEEPGGDITSRRPGLSSAAQSQLESPGRGN